jgi:hypothetical protein
VNLPRSIRPALETPRPRGVHGSYGRNVIEWAYRELGLTFGPWQAYAILQALRYDRNGDLIARTALLSTARQNGKSVIVRGLIGWMLDEGRCLPAFSGWTAILAAAHDAKQARIAYRGVMGDSLGNPRLKQTQRITEWRGISSGPVFFDTVTGQPGSARGWSAGAIAWDEMLTQRDWEMWEALSPTQSAQRSPIMLLTSTAGHADSVVLRAFYDRLLRQGTGAEKPDRSFYGAWWQSEDKDAGLDWKQIKQANPGLGDGRLSKAAIISEHELLPHESWSRERLNHFVDVAVEGAFNPSVWARCRESAPLGNVPGPYAMAVDIVAGWQGATIGVAAIRPDGRIGFEVYRELVGPVTADDITAAVAGFSQINMVHVVAYDGVSGGASAFERHAQETGIPWRASKPTEIVAASMDVTEMILSGRLAVDDRRLDEQIAWTARREVGSEGGFRFTRGASGGPIDAVMAMTIAVHASAGGDPMPRIT